MVLVQQEHYKYGTDMRTYEKRKEKNGQEKNNSNYG